MADLPFRVPLTTPPCARIGIMERLVIEGARNPLVLGFARAVPGHTRLQVARAALAAVQRVPYVPGPKGEEWMQPAQYTLRRGGECKALSVLLGAVLKIRGIPAEIVWITQKDKNGRPLPLNHVTVLVTEGPNQYWADPSVPGALLGESPYDAIERTDSWHVVGGRRG